MSSNSDIGKDFNPERSAQEIGISTSSYLRLCRVFLESTRTDLEELRQAVARRDASSAGTVAHHIKGAARNMEFKSVAQTAETLVQVAQAGETETLPRYMERIEEEFGEAAAVIERYL